jgi:hypothetical protein
MHVGSALAPYEVLGNPRPAKWGRLVTGGAEVFLMMPEIAMNGKPLPPFTAKVPLGQGVPIG